MHGGRVEAHSDGSGTGSTFVVRLPLVGAGARSEGETKTDGSVSPAPLLPLSPSGSLRVLVADDNQDAVESLAALLRVLGHDVRMAADGAEAVRAAGEFRPEVAFLDIGMPRMNGYEAARQIRGTESGRGLVLVALTGWGQEEDRRRSREAGFDHHLVKPLDPTALAEVLAGVRRGRQFTEAGRLPEP
jgi:CheY-like chemotaxis protein